MSHSVSNYLTRLSVVVCGVALLCASQSAFAGVVSTIRSGSVGGISINASGVVANPSIQDQKNLSASLLKAMKQVPGGLNAPTSMRKVSLKGLEAAIQHAMDNNQGVLPDEVKYLAGLQRIEYVFVYPEQNDIVLAGPGEGWTVDKKGNVVGITTGRPVLQLEDLVVALRTVDNARSGQGITCSIDPTAEGRQRLKAYLNTVKQFHPSVKYNVEQAMGQQKISLTGVPEDSHFARVLIAADYRMKRIAMNLDKSPVRKIPSYINMLPSARAVTNMSPRWWLACNYEPLARSADGMAWQIRGQGVKAMTEDELITEDGQVQQTGKTSGIAQKWADKMTDNYDELSGKDKVFGDLRNIMDMCVVAALIKKEGLDRKAGLELPLIEGQTSALKFEGYPAPKSVGTQCSMVKKGKEWIITASGGVDINSWEIAGNSTELVSMQPLRKENNAPEGSTWWWN
ncbi:MAG: hypothetical protein COA78_28880 [Blastopirellula sp.]|nr:MAG: hypothetical protein COA78_28880 [Blastopirellula sp.]